MSHSLADKCARATMQAVAAAYAVALVGYATPLLFGAYFGGDLTRYEVGVLCGLRAALAGDEGLWLSRLIGNGAALFSEVGAQLFYPPRWLAFVVPADLGASVTVVVHLPIAAATSAWLLRTYGVRPIAAAAGGVVFAAAGPTVDLIQHSIYVAGAAWIPLAWAGARRALAPRGGRLPLSAVVGAHALLLLGGEAQAFAIAAALTVSEAIVRVVRHSRARARVMKVLAALGSGGATGAIVIVPAFLESALTRRGSGFTLDEVVSGAFPPAQALAAVLPIEAKDAVAALGGSTTSAWTVASYLGVSLVAAFVAGAFIRRTRFAQFVAVAAGLAALGGATPFFPLLVRVIPPLATFRYPAKYLVVGTLALVVVSMAALSAASASRARRGEAARRRALVAWGLSGLALGVGVVVAPASMRAPIGTAAAVVTCACIASVARGSLRSALPCIVALDIVLLGALPALRVGPPVLSRPSLVADIGAPTDVLCVSDAFARLTLARAGDDPAWAYDAAHHAFGTPDLQSCDGRVSATPYVSLQPALNHELEVAMSEGVEGAARALGCDIVVLPSAPATGQAPALVRVDAKSLDRVAAAVGASWGAWRVTDALPPAFLVRDPRWRADEDEVLRDVLVGDGRAGLRTVDQPLYRRAAPAMPAGEFATIVRLRTDTVDDVVLEVEGAGGAVVGVRRLFLRGWRAEQDGVALEVVRVAANHVAVIVPDVGRGAVRLFYRPPGLPWAAAASVLGALSSILLVRTARSRR